jgi:hypothetical protein
MTQYTKKELKELHARLPAIYIDFSSVVAVMGSPKDNAECFLALSGGHYARIVVSNGDDNGICYKVGNSIKADVGLKNGTDAENETLFREIFSDAADYVMYLIDHNDKQIESDSRFYFLTRGELISKLPEPS